MVYGNYFFLLIISLVLHPSYCHTPNFDCGDVVDIYHPFEFKGTSNSVVNDDFVVTCVNATNPHNYSSNNFKPKVFLSKFNLEVIRTEEFGEQIKGVVKGYITVKIPVAKSCGVDHTDYISSSSLDLSGSVFHIDTTENVFASVGCDVDASLHAYMEGRGGNYQTASCSSRCNLESGQEVSIDGSGCNGYNYCCQSDLRSLPPFQRYTVNFRMTGNDHKSCRAGFLTSRVSLLLNSSIAQALSAQSATVPVVLQYWYSVPPIAVQRRPNTALFIEGIAIFALIVCIPTLVAASCCFWFCWLYKTKRERKENKLRAKYFKTRLKEEWSSNMDVAEKTKLFRLKELKEATNNFDKDRILGQGGQGTVYKGILKNGQLIAVKKSRAFEERHWKQFINEVILLSKINHRNVVKLLGCCLGTKAPMLVYEFITNGTLSDYIHKSEQAFITWEMRIRIASEVAGAFSYLHSSLSTPIYHRDIKSTNILLDEHNRAKVADFGISMVVSIDQTHMTTGVQGTFGYLDPEYQQSSRYSEKSEVYSFGVILVELLTRQHPVRVFTSSSSSEERSLVVYFVSSMNESRLEEILDPIVLEEGKMDDVMVVAELAKRCLKRRGMDRPIMKEVAMELEGLWKRISSTPNANVVQRAASLEIKSFANHEPGMVSHAHTSPIIISHKDVNSTDGNRDEEQPLCSVT